jgi:hypothetical protein
MKQELYLIHSGMAIHIKLYNVWQLLEDIVLKYIQPQQNIQV